MTAKTKLLLIEDEPDINLLAKTALKVKNFEVISVINGIDGIEQARNNDFDLIILDVSMPDMNGYEVLFNLQNDPETCNIPVVFFSALVQSGEIEKGIELGAIGYIKKPFDPDTLHLEVKKYLKESVKEREEVGSNEVDKELVGKYLESLKTNLVKLESDIRNNRFEEISFLGHRLAGSGESYGFPLLTKIGYKLEESGKQKSIDKIKEVFEKLLEFYDSEGSPK